MNLDYQPLPKEELGKYMCHCGQRAIRFQMIPRPGKRPLRQIRCGGCRQPRVELNERVLKPSTI